MASAIFRPSRLIAVALVLGVAAWVGSGLFSGEAEEHAGAEEPKVEAATVPIQRVGVTPATPEMHERQIALSCTTQADHQASAVARGAGIVVQLQAVRGAKVRAGDLLALISDEGRESAVRQAQALLDQRQAEYTAQKGLIDRGSLPKNQLAVLEAGVAAATAALSAAQAELERVTVRAPVDGVVDEVPIQVGQAVQPGTEIAQIIGPDPMLAVGSVSERHRGNLHVGQETTVRFIDNKKVNGTVSFVAVSGETATRTYRVEAKIPNADSAIADGVTCEMMVTLEPVEAAGVPRSALVFSDDGRLGVRIADKDSKALFVPVQLVDDGRATVWVTGLDGPARVITVGQDFVKDGDPVEAVSAASIETTAEPPA